MKYKNNIQYINVIFFIVLLSCSIVKKDKGMEVLSYQIITLTFLFIVNTILGFVVVKFFKPSSVSQVSIFLFYSIAELLIIIALSGGVAVLVNPFNWFIWYMIGVAIALGIAGYVYCLLRLRSR